MLNLIQHLTESRTYETLNQVQGDKSRLFANASFNNFFVIPLDPLNPMNLEILSESLSIVKPHETPKLFQRSDPG